MARKINHYKVTHNENYNNFMIGQNLLFENELEFVYRGKDHNDVRKVIPLKHIGPYLKQRKLFSKTDDGTRGTFKGICYEIPASIIFNY